MTRLSEKTHFALALCLALFVLGAGVVGVSVYSAPSPIGTIATPTSRLVDLHATTATSRSIAAALSKSASVASLVDACVALASTALAVSAWRRSSVAAAPLSSPLRI